MGRKLLATIKVALMLFALTGTVIAQSGPWATAYYAGWMQGYNNTGYLPAQNVDYSAVTHIIHFSLIPRSDGTLDDAGNSVTAFNANEVVTRAHAVGKKVIICVGGWGSDVAFRGATNQLNLSNFVSNLVNLMKARGYDGIDVDWETLSASDAVQYTGFIRALRSALNAVTPRPLLMAATAWQPAILAQVQDQFDQINLMTYDLAGAWPGWVTWPNSPLYDGGYRFPSNGGAPPSADRMVDNFIAAGIPANKLGIGIDFYGYVWTGGAGTSTGGATEPRQSWTTAPSVQSNVPYSTIMKNYFQPLAYRWDNATQSAHLSLDNTGSTSDKYITYDDETTILRKIEYTRTKGIGGVIIWELGGGYRADLAVGQKDPLLQAVKQGLSSTLPVQMVSFDASASGPDVQLAWRTASETNSYGFEVERREVNTASWETIGFVQGAGTSTSSRDYSYLDRNLAAGRYAYRIKQIDNSGTFTYTAAVEVEVLLTGVAARDAVPERLSLGQNYPNPFNPSTQIPFELPEKSRVTLTIVDLLGRVLRTLVNGEQSAGRHTVTFNAADLPTGIYLYRLEAGPYVQTGKMILAK